ncbi:2Fe-2S iron-sulfur cluster-binding protein [Oceanibium sediminis]|uniref:2Fe-2S iron-sulfur cluster-binding protein n=1 Tax=Oceanibium sediminis TaxID=2026339 RepID=UPI001E4CCA6B|nr:2Fe-2S iron-sulfur cluster-binding protein [Oceanibium sediminis]
MDDQVDTKIRIRFLTSGVDDVEVPAGSNLLRMSIRYQGGLPFKCGGGMCGTCFCKIEEGAENTGPLTGKEKKMLTDEEVAQGHRLGCQTSLNGDVAVSWIPLDQRATPGRKPLK